MATAFVTGASRGIGAAVAARLAADGYDLILHYHRDASGVMATQATVEETGRTATVLQADLRDPEAAWTCAEAAGSVDAFVANAGAYDRRDFADMAGEAWRQTMALNLDAPAAMTQALLPQMADDARIVYVSSIAARRGSSHGAHYAAAKAGLLGLTRSLAKELAPRRVNAVLPGYIDTAILDEPPERRRLRELEVPLGRVGTPEDIAGAVAWLCGPDSGYVTGACIDVDGGL